MQVDGAVEPAQRRQRQHPGNQQRVVAQEHHVALVLVQLGRGQLDGHVVVLIDVLGGLGLEEHGEVGEERDGEDDEEAEPGARSLAQWFSALPDLIILSYRSFQESMKAVFTAVKISTF